MQQARISRRCSAACFLLCASLAAKAACAQTQAPPTAAELAAITERGRALEGYDQAVWHAGDAVQMANPKTTDGQMSIAREQDGKWTVVFGALTPDKGGFLLRYEAKQGSKAKEFVVTRVKPAREDTGFYLFAARAIALCEAEFRASNHPARAYALAVLPAPQGQLYVYLYPAQTQAGAYPLGADARYLVSADGQTIVQKRPLHQSLLEGRPPSAKDSGKKPAMGWHTHTLSDVPEDTDVLHVLQQDPAQPEMVVTPHFAYLIGVDGSIAMQDRKKVKH